jgi:HEAT repeats
MRMPTRHLVLVVSIAAAALFGSSAAAQPPRVVNSRLTSQAAASPLAQSFRTLVGAQAEAAWIGYAVPVVEGERVMCCGDSGGGISFVNGSASGRYCCGPCRLEPSAVAATPTARTGQPSPPTGPIKLEAAERMIVLFRAADRKVDRIRVFSDDCELDAGGRPVIWLEGVRASESVALLETFAVPEPERRDKGTLDGAVTAIALHGDASADAALDRLVAASQPEAVRRKVTFWLGNTRGAHGLATLQRVLRDDPSLEVRKSAVFGLSQVKDDAGVTTLVAVAKNNTDAAVRGEAIFWLGQKAGAKAAGAITDRIDNDPNTEVKKRAVFALSQMPASEGVPLLIAVARTHANREVRKQAMFWLGQSKDPRALAFFEEVLTVK